MWRHFIAGLSLLVAHELTLPGQIVVGQESYRDRAADSIAFKASPVETAGARSAAVSIEDDPEPRLVNRAASFPTLDRQNEPEVAEVDSGAGDFPELAGPAVTMASSLIVVLGLFAGLVWLTRRFGTRRGGGELPAEWIEPLGSTSIDSRTRVTLLRCGGRVIVVAQTQSGFHPLTEITDPDEVRRTLAACRGESRAGFAETLASMEREPSTPGFIGEPPAKPMSRGRLFATA
jgi:flagellar biogenesis protein FliO